MNELQGAIVTGKASSWQYKPVMEGWREMALGAWRGERDTGDERVLCPDYINSNCPVVIFHVALCVWSYFLPRSKESIITSKLRVLWKSTTYGHERTLLFTCFLLKINSLVLWVLVILTFPTLPKYNCPLFLVHPTLCLFVLFFFNQLTTFLDVWFSTGAWLSISSWAASFEKTDPSSSST